MPRTTYEVEVIGLEKLQELADLQRTFNTRLLTSTQRMNEFKTAAAGAAAAVGSAAPAQQNFNRALSDTEKNSTRAASASRSMLTTMLGYRALGEVIGIIGNVTKAMGEYEMQTARVSRVSSESSKVLSSELRVEVAKYGGQIKDAGEGLYQLGTQIRDTNTLFSAQDTLLKLITERRATVGTRRGP